MINLGLNYLSNLYLRYMLINKNSCYSKISIANNQFNLP